MEFSRSRQQFYRTVRQPAEAINLAEAALYIAQEEYADVDVAEYINALDTMAAEVAERLPAERYPLRIIQTINQYLYDDLGFVGNTVDYYDPDNSYLNRVIDRRCGIPITLSLVYLEIAQRLDFLMVGIGMPAHFLIRPAVGEMEIFVDPFHQGEVLFADDCRDRLSQIYGRPVELQPEFLQAVTAPQLLARMLTNLKVIYLNKGDMKRCLAAIERILLLYPDVPNELRDRGLLYYQMGRWPEAYQDLERYLLHDPAVGDAAVVRQLLQRMEQDF